MFTDETAPPFHQSNALDVGACTDAGLVRERNEDAYALPPDGVPEERLGSLYVVADGIGGVPEGDVASRDATAQAPVVYYSNSGPQDIGDRLGWCTRAVNSLNWLAKAEEPGERRQTTFVAAVICHDELHITSLGDSRAYLVQPDVDQPELLTQDDTPEERNKRQKSTATPLSEEPRSYEVDAGIGIYREIIPPIYYRRWRPGDTLVLTSDGLNEIRETVLTQIVKQFPPPQAAENLIKLANRQGGVDNSTVIIVHWRPLPKKARHPQRRPPLHLPYLLLAFLLGLLLGLTLLYVLPYLSFAA